MYEEDRESSDLVKNKPIKVFELGNRPNILPEVILEVVRARHVEELRKKLQAEKTKNWGEPPACTDPESAGTSRICAHALMWASARTSPPWSAGGGAGEEPGVTRAQKNRCPFSPERGEGAGGGPVADREPTQRENEWPTDARTGTLGRQEEETGGQEEEKGEREEE